LVENFGASILFSTATQPALSGTIGTGQNLFNGIEANTVRELVPDFLQLSKDLKRVQVQMPDNINQPTEWAVIADELKEFEQALCIVNTRKDCRELHKLMPEGTIHLSRMMCSAHVMDTIAEIKQKLKDGELITVISTQLIEAGVDVDFPIVYRALAGLDSIAQSAGRCNREGKQNKTKNLGLTKVFCTINGTPPGLMRKGADTLKELLNLHPGGDFLDPTMFQQYFSLFYSKVQNFDKPMIQDLLVKDEMQMKFQFATAARDFRLIDDKGAQSILVEYMEGADLINLLKRKGPETWLMRKLQRYAVSVNARDFEDIRKAGLIEEVHGCWVQAYEKLYNSKAGLMSNGEWLEEIHII
jgi:CRISPR-associated endonuclease/helicase Cas3